MVSGNFRTHILVCIVYVFLTLLMTYPLVLRMHGNIPGTDLGDPLFITWVISWDMMKMKTDLSGFWDANIYYPNNKTLAYSEHFVVEAILALPFSLVSRDAIFSYNMIFLLSFILSGYGAYLLIYKLTGSRPGALIGGAFYAFCPFRFYHIGHLQLLFSQWFPFVLYYLHNLRRSLASRDLLLAVVFMGLQGLSCGYYALFLVLVVGLFILLYFHREILSLDARVLAMISLMIVLYALFMIPFFSPYVQVRKTMGFVRSLNEVKYYSAGASSYFLPPPELKFWGHMVRLPGKAEGHLFPGVIVALLSVYGLRKYWGARSRELGGKLLVSIAALCKGLFLMTITVIIIQIFTGGFSLKVFGMPISVHELKNPFVFLAVFGGLYIVFSSETRGQIRRFMQSLPKDISFYLLLVILSMTFSFYYPYSLLYSYLPGFDGIRVPARFAMLASLGLSVLAGFGAKRMTADTLRKWRTIASATVITGVLLECFSVPIPLPAVGRIPPVYGWLARQHGGAALIELPMGAMREYKYVYYSTQHWKNIVNGISGYIPPSYGEMLTVMDHFPGEASMTTLKRYGVDRIIVHLEEFPPRQRNMMMRSIESMRSTLSVMKRFDDTLVVEVL